MPIHVLDPGPRSTLIVAAHPDDEVLGCGGTAARLAAAGCEVHVRILCGTTSSRGTPSAEADAEFEKAAGVLGAASTERWDYPDNRLDTVPLLEIVQRIARAANETAPELVLTHDPSDLNIDHVLAHRATITAFRPLPGAGHTMVACYETLSSTEYQDAGVAHFRPSWYVDIGATLERKLDAMRCYASELCDPPHPRSLDGIETLARRRGHEVGRAAAEAFRIVRLVD